MSKTAADVLIETLEHWGVDTIFGLPGDGINGIMESLRAAKDRIRFVQVRHEEGAAFMACAYAKFTGKLGVCLATSGPGGIHLLNGLYDAKMDGQPVLAITGHHYHDLIDTHQQQDVDLDRVFMDVAVYTTRVMGPAHVRSVSHLACRMALSRRGVAHINFPTDTQSMTVSEDVRSRSNVPGHSETDIFSRPAGLPAMQDLERAADILNRGSRVAILAGQGALHARYELLAMAAKLGAPIIKALLGKGCVPDDSPYTTGGIGLLGTGPSEDAIMDCDTLLMVGTSFPYIEFLPKPGRARCVQIDCDPARIGLRYPADVGLAGDSKRTLEALQGMVKRKANRRFLEKAQEGMIKWRKTMHERAHRMDMPMKPQVFAAAIGELIDDDAVVCCDSGTIATWFARHIPVRGQQLHSLSGTLATMANGLSYAIGAQIAYPDRQVVALVGDGGFAMLMCEFITAVKHKLPIKVFINKNNTLGQIKWEQMVLLGNPEFGCELQPVDFAAFARACGGHGFTVDDPRRARDVVAQALATPGPVVIEGVVDPNEPPLPGKIKASQALHFAEALARGTPNRMKIISTVTEDEIREMV